MDVVDNNTVKKPVLRIMYAYYEHVQHFLLVILTVTVALLCN